MTLDLKASVFYIDMDGMHDGQAIKTIISDLQPRKVVRPSLCLAFDLRLTSQDLGQVDRSFYCRAVVPFQDH